MAATHVPKFGNWDGDNVPYTAFFENARKGRAAGSGGATAGKVMNPNDPAENPEAFAFSYGENNVAADNKKSSFRKSHKGFIPSSSPPKNGRYNPADDQSYMSASSSVPKFGVWDEMDPKSGEGFTQIFNKVKKDKKIAASKLPPVNSQPNSYSTYANKPNKSKMFCCLF